MDGWDGMDQWIEIVGAQTTATTTGWVGRLVEFALIRTHPQALHTAAREEEGKTNTRKANLLYRLAGISFVLFS